MLNKQKAMLGMYQTKSNAGDKANYLSNLWKTEEENYIRISNIL
jgi:hypothetical protein